MKLKKIASLALAGLMAVSMLAGCGDNSTNKGEDVVVNVGSSSIVDAVNNGQDVTNKVKVTFASDSELQSNLELALKITGNAKDATVKAKLDELMVEDYKDAVTDLWNGETNPKDNSDLDGEDQTYMTVYKINASEALNEQAALKVAARKIDDNIVSQLVARTDDSKITVTDNKYYVYDYEGSVAMVAVENNNGSTVYFVAVTLTQTATEKEV